MIPLSAAATWPETAQFAILAAFIAFCIWLASR